MSPAPKKPAEADAEAEATHVEATEVEATEVEETAEPKPAAEKPAAKKPAARKPAAAKKPAAEKPAQPAPKAKPARKREERELITVRAHAKYVRTSARKARLVCDHIRGKSVTEARAILQLTPRAVARDWSKLLESAVANAENNHELIGDELRIHAVTADEGPTLKRFRPRAMGRATKIRKRTSHLSIGLEPKE